MSLNRNLHKNTFKVTLQRSLHITFWKLLRKYQSFTFVTNTNDELPRLSTDFISSDQHRYNKLPKISGKPLYKVCKRSMWSYTQSSIQVQSYCIKRHTTSNRSSHVSTWKTLSTCIWALNLKVDEGEWHLQLKAYLVLMKGSKCTTPNTSMWSWSKLSIVVNLQLNMAVCDLGTCWQRK